MSSANELEPAPESATTESVETTTTTENVAVISETEIAVDQLRALVCGLVVGLLLSCSAFTLYIFKETRTLKYQIGNRQAQLKQTQEFLKVALPTVNDLANYSVGKPELTAIFGRYGLKIGQSVAPTQTSAPGFQPMP